MVKRVAQAAQVLIVASLSLHAEWPTFGHDQQRSGWAAEEKLLNVQTAPDLELKWSVQLDNTPLALSALTAPVVAGNVATSSGTKTIVYIAGSSNRLFAVDAASGRVVWQRTFPSFVTPKGEAFFLCPNSLNATPVVDRGRNLIFTLASDGRLFGLDLATGSFKFGPYQLVPPFAKAWSLNLNNGHVYTTTSQGCGGDRSGIYSMSVDDPVHRVVYETVVRSGSGAGMWARGGTSISEGGVVYVSTGDADFDPARKDFGCTFLAASAPELNISDYFTPRNWREINEKDLDLPSGGHLWFSYQGFHLIVGGGKESVVYLLDADNLGGKDHQTALYISPQLGNEEKALEQKGIWGAPALWKDGVGRPWIYIPLWGAPAKEITESAGTNSGAPHGSIAAFRVEMGDDHKPRLKLAWISPDVDLPDAPAVADGVVFVMATGENPHQVKTARTTFKSEQDWKQNLLTTGERGAGTHPAVLMALDAQSGKLLYQSGTAMKSWNHFGGLAINDAKIFSVDYSSTLYCFGVRSR